VRFTARIGLRWRRADALLPPQLVVTVTGFQLYRDANEFYFAHECAPARAACSLLNAPGSTPARAQRRASRAPLPAAAAAGGATARAS
jgi:hypothetical protein